MTAAELTALPTGTPVTAKRLGWDEVLPPDSDLDPYDAPTDDLSGPLEVRLVGGRRGVPRHAQHLVGGHPADPETIRAGDYPSGRSSPGGGVGGRTRLSACRSSRARPVRCE